MFMTGKLQIELYNVMLDAINEEEITDENIAELAHIILHEEYILGEPDAKQWLQDVACYDAFEAIYIVRDMLEVEFERTLTTFDAPYIANTIVAIAYKQLVSKLESYNILDLREEIEYNLNELNRLGE